MTNEQLFQYSIYGIVLIPVGLIYGICINYIISNYIEQENGITVLNAMEAANNNMTNLNLSV